MTCSSPIKDKYFQSIVFPINSVDLILFGNQFCRYVEHLFHCEIFCILDGMPIVWVILSHEYRWFQCWRHEHSPYHRLFFAIFWNIHRRSLSAFFALDHFTLSKNDLDPDDKSNSVSSSPMMTCCALAPPWGQTTGFPVLSLIFFFFQNDVLVFTRETWLTRVCTSLMANNGFHRSVIHQFIRFPLLRRPRFVIVPFWVACSVRAFNKSVVVPWRVTCVTANNGFLRSIIFLSFHTQRTLTFVTSLPWAFWCRRWQSRGSPCNKTHHWPRLRCDSLFSWFFLRPFWYHFRTICRTEMASVEQTQKMIPFVTCEISLG